MAAPIHYIIQSGETADAEAFVRELASRVLQYEDNLMTIAHMMLQQGMSYDVVVKVTGLSMEELASLNN